MQAVLEKNGLGIAAIPPVNPLRDGFLVVLSQVLQPLPDGEAVNALVVANGAPLAAPCLEVPASIPAHAATPPKSQIMPKSIGKVVLHTANPTQAA